MDQQEDVVPIEQNWDEFSSGFVMLDSFFNKLRVIVDYDRNLG